MKRVLTRCALLVVLCPSAVWAQDMSAPAPEGLEEIGVDEHLNAKVPTGLKFRDHQGKSKLLSSYFDGERPVVLNLAYHSCPVLCNMVLHATVDGLRTIGWSVGKEFDVVTLSIDPRDTPEAATEKREMILERYGRDSADQGWHFLVGKEENIQQVADAVGFRYAYDEDQDQYAHPAVIMLLTPEAKVARYLYGLEFKSNDLKLGLLEASAGRSISTVDRVILYCFQYHKGEGYVLVANRVMQVGGVATALVLALFLFVMWRRERRSYRRKLERGTARTIGAPRVG